MGGSIRYDNDFGTASLVTENDSYWTWMGSPQREDVIEVYLSRTPITDEEIWVLRHFPNMRELDVRFTAIGDKALQGLYGTSLETLWLAGTNVTEQGISQFQESMPNCEVIW